MLVLLSFAFQIVFAQNSPREIFDFDHGWELYRIEDTVHFQQSVIRKGTSFASQFNYDHIAKRNQSVDSIINTEVSGAMQGFDREYPKIKSLKWEKVTLPCPARYEQKLNPGKGQFVGICYYRKKFNIPADIQNKRLAIKFEGAMQMASVWINGKPVMQHQGGYLPFSIPLNDIKSKAENEIIVRLDNRDNPNSPPGKPLAKLGFLYWSGIYRDAWLIATDAVHITDPIESNTIAGGGMFVRYENVSECSATILIKTQIKNSLSQAANNIKIKQIISEKNGKIIQQTISNSFNLTAERKKETEQNIILKNPKLWSPDNPYLYQLTTEIWLGNNLVDKITKLIGIRTLSYTRWEGFKLNGKPLLIVGTNRHQDHPFIGNALSGNEQYRDLKMIKEAGMNFVRLAHYPNDPSVYDICDSLGLMVADPIPGWQFFNNNTIFKERVFRDIREMIRRDRNHPCVIMWEASLNESYPPDSFRIRSSYIAHEEYPGDQCFIAGDIYGSKKTAWEVPYNGWDDPFGRPQDVQPERPGFVREYGDYKFGGLESTTRVNRSNGEKALLGNAWNLQWEHNLLNGPEYYPWTIGDANWAFFDGFEAPATTTSDWGVSDVFRIPKFSYYFFRSQMDPYAKIHGADNKPVIFIANWWTPRDTATKIIVYSNCEEVALYVNNKLIKKQKPDNGPDSPYGDWEKGGNPFDAGNSRHLQHPPFTFTGIRFEKGELKAEGYIKNKVMTQDIRRTPDQPDSLHIEVNFAGKPLKADGADVVFVYASVIDKNGTVNILDNSTQIQLEVSGAATIVSPAMIKVRGGIASFLIRANDLAGIIQLKAHANGSNQLNAVMEFNPVKENKYPRI
jgi:beta-galactosidase